MEKAIDTSYQESADASSIYRDRTAADFALQSTAAVAGNLADAMRDAVVIFMPTLFVDSATNSDDPRGPVAEDRSA